MIRWLVLLSLLGGCSFSPDQCIRDVDCPEGQRCILRKEVLLCETPNSNPNVIPNNQSDMSTDTEEPEMDIPLERCGQCRIDIYEPNDTHRTAYFLGELECPQDVILDERIEASLCQDDDWFEAVIKLCDDRTYLLEIIVDLHSDCAETTWDVIGPDWRCEDPDVACVDSGTQKIRRFLIGRRDWSERLRVGIRSEGARTNYTVRTRSSL